MEHQGQPGGPDDIPDEDAYRTLGARLAKGVAIISAVQRGRDHATPVIDLLSVSWDPPTMLVSLFSLGRMAEAVEDAKYWAVSVLAADQGPVADWLGEPGTPLVGLLDNVPHERRAPGHPALISGALAWFELRTTTVLEVATHTLVVGEVEWMGGPAFGRDPLVRFENRHR